MYYCGLGRLKGGDVTDVRLEGSENCIEQCAKQDWTFVTKSVKWFSWRIFRGERNANS